MSIIIRKTGNREYVYEAHRDGPRMVQTYLGPLARPDVQSRVKAARRAATVPAHTMRLFTSVSPGVVSLQRNSTDVIATILEHGDLDDVGWLTCAYPGSAIVDAVLAGTGLSPRTRNFWRIWFEVSDAS